MKKIERVRAALDHASLDRPPYSFWTHLPGIDLNPARLVEETVAKRPIVGGLQRTHLTRCDRAAVQKDIQDALRESGGKGILLAPACVIRHPVDQTMLEWTAQVIKAGD